jgi:hypothetical protein
MPHPQPTRSVLARHADHTGVEMDHYYELGMALAMAQIAELRRQPGVFDAGHCRACAHQAGMLDHYRQVQQEQATLRETQRWARGARRRARVALWWAGAALLLAAVALLTG